MARIDISLRRVRVLSVDRIALLPTSKQMNFHTFNTKHIHKDTNDAGNQNIQMHMQLIE